MARNLLFSARGTSSVGQVHRVRLTASDFQLLIDQPSCFRFIHSSSESAAADAALRKEVTTASVVQAQPFVDPLIAWRVRLWPPQFQQPSVPKTAVHPWRL
jgi:hypothetical protein